MAHKSFPVERFVRGLDPGDGVVEVGGGGRGLEEPGARQAGLLDSCNKLFLTLVLIFLFCSIFLFSF